MLHKKVNQYPLWAWILVAMSAPAAQLASRGPWLGVLTLAIVCGGLCWGILSLSKEQPALKRWYCAVEFFFLIVISGKFASMASTCWPTGDSYPTVSLTLLILAAFSALDGVDRASRIGGVLFWFLALLYAIILGSSVKDLNMKWFVPSMKTPHAMLVVIFLIPAAASLLPREKGKASTAAIVTAGIFAVVVSLLTAGTMPPTAVNSLQDPFYEFSKSLSLFGVAERFEALASVALTLSYFALLSFLLSIAGHLAEAMHPEWGRPGVLCCAAAVGIILLLGPKIPEIWLALLTALFWGVLPLLSQLPLHRKG